MPLSVDKSPYWSEEDGIEDIDWERICPWTSPANVTDLLRTVLGSGNCPNTRPVPPNDCLYRFGGFDGPVGDMWPGGMDMVRSVGSLVPSVELELGLGIEDVVVTAMVLLPPPELCPGNCAKGSEAIMDPAMVLLLLPLLEPPLSLASNASYPVTNDRDSPRIIRSIILSLASSAQRLSSSVLEAIISLRSSG